MSTQQDDVAAQAAGALAPISGMVAVSLGGSAVSGLADESSDLDLHVYWSAPLDSARERADRLAAIADPGSVRVDLTSWGLEDQFSIGGQPVELIYRRWDDVRDEVERAYGEGLVPQGFTTAVLYSVAHGELLHDPTGVLGAARDRLTQRFPEPTREAVLRRQSPLLGFHLTQLRRAQRRSDLLFVQHLRYKLQMLSFDVLFALNRMYHPGEKRLMDHSRRCAIRPPDCEARLERVARLPPDNPTLADELEALMEDLRDLVRAHSRIEIPAEPW